MNTVLIIFNLLSIPYFYEYLWRTLSQTQKIVWCGFEKDNTMQFDAAQKDCYKLAKHYNNDFNVLVVQYMPNHAFADIISDADRADRLWLFVSEQTSISANKHKYSRYAEKYENLRYVHYSNANSLRLFSEIRDKRVRHVYLPYVPCNLVDFERLRKKEKKYDVAFVGHMGPYRSHIVSRLEKLYNLIDIRTFGDDKDRQVAESKVLINIHYDDQYEVLESLRCVPAYLAGTLVVSQNSAAQTLSDIEREFIFADYEKLVDTVNKTLQQFDKLYNEQKKFLDYFDPLKYPHCQMGFSLYELELLIP